MNGIKAADISLNFKLTGFMENPSNLDYTLYGLYKKDTYTEGVITKSEYYKEYNSETLVYSDLVVEKNIAYNRSVTGLAINRIITITWYMEDDSIGFTREITEPYSYQESFAENEKRRINLMFDVRVYLFSQIGSVNTFDVVDSLSLEVINYVRGMNQPLIDGIQASTKPYLTQEMKDYTINILDI